jgi:hypothetical protein
MPPFLVGLGRLGIPSSVITDDFAYMPHFEDTATTKKRRRASFV